MKIALFFICAGLFAEEAAAPQITMEEQRDYQRVRADLAVAQGAFDRQVNAMLKKCGDRGLVTDAKGDPECGKAK